jgi:hypothetical protein
MARQIGLLEQLFGPGTRSSLTGVPDSPVSPQSAAAGDAATSSAVPAAAGGDAGASAAGPAAKPINAVGGVLILVLLLAAARLGS